MAQLSIVVTCTSTKCVRPLSALMARNLPNGTIGRRLQAWQSHLHSATQLTPLWELYGGPAWAQVEHLERTARTCGWAPQLYVASAGLGLRRLESVGPAYAATFSSGSPDQVAQDLEGRTRWWDGLASFDGAQTLSELDGEVTLLVLGATYSAAMARDLTDEANRGRSMYLIGGANDLSAIHRVPVERRLRKALGGATTSLGPRTASAWLSLATPRSLGTRRHEQSWQRFVLENSADDSSHRERLSDAAVTEAVRGLLRVQPFLSRTEALRIIRGQGFACEQRRFATLFTALTAA